MRAKSVCEGNTSNPRNQLDSKKVLPLAGKFTPTATPTHTPSPARLHPSLLHAILFTTGAEGHSVPLVLVLVADVVGFALKYTVRHEICTCPYN